MEQGMEEQIVDCVFEYKSWKLRGDLYNCTVSNQTLNPEAILKFNGTHHKKKDNRDIFAISFRECKMKRIPKRLVSTFPNLKVLYIFDCGLESLERNDLNGYDSLSDLILPFNRITFLPEDLFVHMERLENFTITRNALKLVEPNIFDNLPNLENLDLSRCEFINMKFSLSKDIEKNSTLEEIKKELSRKYIEKMDTNLPPLWKDVIRRMENNEKLLNDLKVAMSRESCKDITVKIGDDRFRLHKLVLIARCPVLARLIEANQSVEQLELVDIDPDVFREIIKFIYQNEFPKSEDINYMHLLAASERLELKELAKFAAKELEEKVNAENAFELLTLSNKFGHMSLRLKAFEQLKMMF